MGYKTISILGYLIIVFSLVLLVFEKMVLAEGVVGLLAQVLAFLLMIWARKIFGKRSFHAAANPTKGGLVTTGPYKFIRHPIYAAILYFIWAAVLTHLTFINVVISLLATAGVFIRIYTEEKLLVHMYPEYADYSKQTKRIIPFLL